jgi:hypothetical protein
MSNFSSGKKAKAISDRSGMAFPYHEMLKEWNGSFVHQSEFESKHPQIEVRSHTADKQALQNARSDRTETAAPILLPLNGLKTANSGTSVITVTEPSHGRSSSDTVRFYDVASFDDNNYTFTVATDTATTGNLRGGGGRAYAGPTTITA